MAGELQADSESAYNFSEHPNRTDALNEIGKIKVHNLENLEDLWVLHLNEINSSGEINNIPYLRYIGSLKKKIILLLPKREDYHLFQSLYQKILQK